MPVEYSCHYTKRSCGVKACLVTIYVAPRAAHVLAERVRLVVHSDYTLVYTRIRSLLEVTSILPQSRPAS